VSFVEIDESNVKYSVVKPIVKVKGRKEEAKAIQIAEIFSEIEEVEMKYTEHDVEEIQEEEVYAVESIMETEDNDEETENYFEEDEGAKTESEEVEKIEIAQGKDFHYETQIFSPSAVSKTSNSHSHKRKATGNEICCSVAFKDYKCYEIHQKAHENFEAIVPHIQTVNCVECNMMFSCEEDLLTHLEIHSEEPGFTIERRGAYEDHFIRNVAEEYFDLPEDNSDLFTCGHCKKKLSEPDMKVHMLFFHTTTVFCPFDNRCFEGIKHVRLFSDHIRNKHPEIFEKNMLYSCRHCKQSFTTNFEKLAHMKLCNAKPFECKGHCNKRFASEWLLKNHLKTINGDDRFSCDTCGKKCVSRSDLQIHERMHTNERPYPCPICQKKFKTSANRSSHMDIHETEKKHECSICGEFGCNFY
jgi:KRAB domain-containing zinc finger protein